MRGDKLSCPQTATAAAVRLQQHVHLLLVAVPLGIVLLILGAKWHAQQASRGQWLLATACSGSGGWESSSSSRWRG